MSCFPRRPTPLLAEAGLPEPEGRAARKALDLRIRRPAGVDARGRCNAVWPSIKQHLADPDRRAALVQGLRGPDPA